MANKPLKFRSETIKAIQSGESDITWRLFDDKDLMVGDVIDLINVTTDKKFGEAEITEVREKKMAEIGEDDMDESERYDSPEEMYAAYKEYYAEEDIGPDTMVKVVRFKYTPETKLDDDEDEEAEEEFSDEGMYDEEE